MVQIALAIARALSDIIKLFKLGFIPHVGYKSWSIA
jgi:hypothetical protein